MKYVWLLALLSVLCLSHGWGSMSRIRRGFRPAVSLVTCAAGKGREDTPSPEQHQPSSPVPLPVDLAETEGGENLGPAWAGLVLLLAGFASNQWSRQALYYLCDFSSNGNAERHINVALDFSKEMYAGLASFGFTIVFAAVSLFSGRVADTMDRRKIVSLSCLIWSLATGLQANARNFFDLVPLRLAVGASQAFYNPAAYTLLADLFPKRILGTVNGIYSSGVYLGGALASLSILIDNRLGWEKTLLVIAGCGCIVSLLMGTLIREPEVQKKSPSTPSPSSSPNGLVASMQNVLSPLEVKLLLSASVLRFCAGFTIGIWKAPFVFAKFAGNENAFAGSNAFIVAVGGLLSSLLGGYLSDLISSPDKNKNPTGKVRGRAWVPAIGSALAAPAWALFVLSDKPEWAVGFLFAEYLVAECWFGPTLAAISGAVPASFRGAANGLFSIATALGNLAPVVVGAFAGGAAGNYALGDVLIASVSGSYALCSILFAAAALEHDRRFAAAERGEKL